MKVTVYTHNNRYGFYIHNNSVSNFKITYNSGVKFDSYKEAEIAAKCYL